MKVNANFQAFASTNFDATQYIPSPAYGVNRFMLDRIGSERARATTIVQYAPNSKFPKHTHIGGEEFVVLEGTFKDQYGEFPAGTYVRNPIGSEHEPWVDADGCTIMVKLLQMADPTPNEGSAPLHIHFDQAKNELGKSVEYGTVAELYTNDLTGEVVEMCWLNPNAVLIADSKCLGGEELFIVSGSLHMGNHDEDIYHRWGWLRFPPTGNSERGNPQRKFLQAGSLGAQVYRKTGHLTEHALSLEKIQINDEETSTIIS